MPARRDGLTGRRQQRPQGVWSGPPAGEGEEVRRRGGATWLVAHTPVTVRAAVSFYFLFFNRPCLKAMISSSTTNLSRLGNQSTPKPPSSHWLK